MKNKNLLMGIVIGIAIILVIVLAILQSYKDYPEEEKESFDEISYTVPSEFEVSEYSDSKYYFYYDSDVKCSLDITLTEKARERSFEKWFKGEITFTLNDELGELEELDINGNKILGIQKRRGEDYSWSQVEYYYGVESSNYYYMINYNIIDYDKGDREASESSLCLTALDSILSSIKTK